MKIFITGVAGFVGSYLADRWLKDGHKVIGVDNLLGGYEDNVPKEVEFYKFDCIERDRLVALLQDVDVVYHCACTAYEGLSVFSPHLITQNTSGITASLISASIEVGVKRFVLMSSMARYGKQEVPFHEGMEAKPQDPYGISKVAGERLLENLATVHGMEYVIVVPHNIIGPRQKYDDPFRNVASIMINRCLQGKPPIIYGDGEQMRCFSFIDDVIEPLVKVATLDVSGQIINIGPDEQFVTINQLAEIIMRITGFEGRPYYVPGRPQEVKFATCSAEKARELLDYKTTVSLEDGLQAIKKYIDTRGVRDFDYKLPIEINNHLLPITWKEKLI